MDEDTGGPAVDSAERTKRIKIEITLPDDLDLLSLVVQFVIPLMFLAVCLNVAWSLLTGN
jgi:hypothetical protein